MASAARAISRAEDGGLARGTAPGVRAIVNMSAGTALDLSRDAIAGSLERAFKAHGQSIDVKLVPPGEIENEIDAAVASGARTIVVGGGDGTVRTAAQRLIGKDIALGILPLGTLNRLARDLDIPRRLDAAAAFLAAAHPTRIDVGAVNGSIFLCNSLMGATLRFSQGRARLRGLPARARLPKYLALIANVISSRRKISIVVDNGSEQMRTRALSVAVTNNGYDETTGWLRRARLDGGKLTMYVSRHRTGWGMAMALLRALFGLWHGDSDVLKLVGSRFVIYSRGRRRRLSNDGEVEGFDTPLTYEILPCALTVLAKPQTGTAERETPCTTPPQARTSL
jgi:diacylglycerol kinase family enzyme